MTTEPNNLSPLPYPPERSPDERNTFKIISGNGNAHHLIVHFGNRDTTIITGDQYLIPSRPDDDEDLTGLWYPDLMIAFGVDRAAHDRSNAYVISEQGKPPDFVLEIAAPLKGYEDVEGKPAYYAALGVSEYWRFDETGEFHKTKLAGDQLVDGRYEPISIVEVGDEILQGYSAALDLYIRWVHQRLEWHDPRTGEHIPTLESERKRRLQAQERRLQAQERRLARIRELEAELERMDRGE